MILRRALPGLLLPLPALAQSAAVGAARVLCTGAVEHPLKDAAADFARLTGRAVTVETGNGGQVAARLRAGEPFHLAVNAANQVPALLEQGALRAGSTREIGRMRLGFAMRAGASLPPLGDEAALAAALRTLPSVAISDGATGATTGRHVAALLDRLAPDVARRPFPRGLQAVESVARGEAGAVITQMSEILAVPGMASALLPDAAQLVTPYVAGIPARAPDADLGLALLAHLMSPAGQAHFRAAGFA